MFPETHKLDPPKIVLLVLLLIAPASLCFAAPRTFVSVNDGTLYLDGRPYYFVGTNYWYGSLLPLEKDRSRGIGRLRKELDFLKANGVTNLRLMAGAEGSGLMNGVTRVGPPLQPEQGKFDEHVLYGLDVLLNEMGKRGMKAVIFLSNNWEWSGGFQQYLIWNHQLSADWLTNKPDWDQLRDNVAKFYSCAACVDAYRDQVEYVIKHRNSVNARRYIEDPTIMAWELVNEPRPMRPAANEAYLKWINDAASFIKSLDRNHLITTGHEGWIGTQDISLFEKAHAGRNIDYVTIHIWPKNWGWFKEAHLAEGYDNAVAETRKYIADNLALGRKLNKPLVVEEFGLPRDEQSVAPTAPTTLRDRYYHLVLNMLGPDKGAGVSGANFWAFGGAARPLAGQLFWNQGDALMGDPPMEEQGLNSVFDSDASTWRVIRAAAKRLPH